MEVNLINEGLKFMVLGMTTVFLFLLLLIVVLKIQAKLIQKFFPEQISTATKAASLGVATAASGKKDDAEVIAAITAAITDHRKN